MFLIVKRSRDIYSLQVYSVACDGCFQVFVLVCHNIQKMLGVVSPLSVRLIVIILHLQLQRAGIRSLSSHTGNTGPYSPASFTFLILLMILRVFPLYLHYDLRRCFVLYYNSPPLKPNYTTIIIPKLSCSNTNVICY